MVDRTRGGPAGLRGGRGRRESGAQGARSGGQRAGRAIDDLIGAVNPHAVVLGGYLGVLSPPAPPVPRPAGPSAGHAGVRGHRDHGAGRTAPADGARRPCWPPVTPASTTPGSHPAGGYGGLISYSSPGYPCAKSRSALGPKGVSVSVSAVSSTAAAVQASGQPRPDGRRRAPSPGTTRPASGAGQARPAGPARLPLAERGGGEGVRRRRVRPADPVLPPRSPGGQPAGRAIAVPACRQAVTTAGSAAAENGGSRKQTPGRRCRPDPQVPGDPVGPKRAGSPSAAGRPCPPPPGPRPRRPARRTGQPRTRARPPAGPRSTGWVVARAPPSSRPRPGGSDRVVDRRLGRAAATGPAAPRAAAPNPGGPRPAMPGPPAPSPRGPSPPRPAGAPIVGLALTVGEVPRGQHP